MWSLELWFLCDSASHHCFASSDSFSTAHFPTHAQWPLKAMPGRAPGTDIGRLGSGCPCPYGGLQCWLWGSTLTLWMSACQTTLNGKQRPVLQVKRKSVKKSCFFFFFPSKFWTNHVKSHLHFAVGSVTQSRPTLCNPMDYSTPGLPVHHQLIDLTQIHVHRVADAIQPSHPVSRPLFLLPSIFPSIRFKWVRSSHQVAKVLEFWLQHPSFQWTPRIDLL